MLRHVFRCKRCAFFAVYYTRCLTTVILSHPNERFTAVSIPFLSVYVSENGGIRSFTIVVSIDLVYDLHIQSATNHNTYVDAEYKKHSWEHYPIIRPIGNIPAVEIQGFPYPFIYAETLKVRLMMQVNCPMSVVNNGRCWSSKLNCQNFTEKTMEYIGFVFPEDIPIASDLLTFI